MSAIEDRVGIVNGCWAGYSPSHHAGEIVQVLVDGIRCPARIVSDSGIHTGVCRYVVVIMGCGTIRHVYPTGNAHRTESRADRLCTYLAYCTPAQCGGRKIERDYWDVSHLAPTGPLE